MVMNQSRREFLRTATAAALAGTLAGGLGSTARAQEEEVTVNGLPGSVLGRTGLEVTKISLGGVLITEPRLLAAIIDQGINFIHTSPGYQNGRSMEAFGEVLKRSSYRDKVVLALKERPEKIDKCLEVLGTDYVDILVPPLTSVGAITDPRIPEEFEKVKKAGKAGFMGWAGHNNTTEIFNKGIDTGWYDATLMGYANIEDPDFLAAAARARKAGIGIFTMKGLPKRNVTAEDPELAATVTSLCSAMLDGQHAHSVLVSMGSFQSVDFYRRMMETRLGWRDTRLEQRYWAAQQGSYCAMCGRCEEECPEAARTMTRILRYRMYDRDYGLHDYARRKYAGLGEAARGLDQRELARCESVCTRGLPIRRMVAEAETLLG